MDSNEPRLATVHTLGNADKKPQQAGGRVTLLAVEVLLAAPEILENDALEADLYFLRDRLILQQTDKELM